MRFASLQDRDAIEAEKSWADRSLPATLYGQIARTAKAFPDRPAISYQLLSGPKDRAETLTWSQLLAQISQAANLFRSLGIGETDVVAYVLPNCTEAVLALLGGAVAGIVLPINPLLEPEQIAAILRETDARVVVTLKPFPKTDVAQKVAEACRHAPHVHTVLEVDLNRYLTAPRRWIVPFLRPGRGASHADTRCFRTELARQPDRLSFDDPQRDRVAAYFHTGGTTGMPKVARHLYSGMLYNGWLGDRLLFSEQDNIMCPLPLFHVFAVHVIVMAAICSGAHVVFPTPQGYRGAGVFDNFWKLCERWRISFIITVPTAVSALMQRPVDADISSVRLAFSGSAPMPMELFKRFESACGITICEGYGLTEATCLVSVNPPEGVKKVGSIGIPLPYTHVRIVQQTDVGPRECPRGEIGEICVASPGVYAGSTYTEQDRNHALFHEGIYLRTGDLGRMDDDGYLWITGRAKDVIIRGGHNIDPAEIEDALLAHPAVAFAGAIGQPDSHAGELPCAFVELCAGAEVTPEELMAHARVHIHERAALPKHLAILPELPKTAVGKVFKPALRMLAITRVYDAALGAAGLSARVVDVRDDRRRGLIARIARNGSDADHVRHCLGAFTCAWDWSDDGPVAGPAAGREKRPEKRPGVN
ncbi:AMP-binding protein [Salipiger aestuarii]|uniref:acyl-CoA synthetase n=1 Tax=Salipiger aestuarii TaxID=568098 RepID=UPI00025B84DB|nr:acyl-CoA synthetase [Salipiger aestuarii]EIE49483.1 AMP-binding domain protein [Citreicella sp. 357]KAA8610083.1 AMP-binding protein [Salipiger aestuarii]